MHEAIERHLNRHCPQSSCALTRTHACGAAHATDELRTVAWNANAVALVTAARHHCQAVILSRFAQAVRDAKDAAVRAVLDRLAVHYALVEISEHGVDWAGCLDADAAARIRAEIKALLAAIRPDAVSLVDAFGFTDKQLSSSLGECRAPAAAQHRPAGSLLQHRVTVCVVYLNVLGQVARTGTCTRRCMTTR